VVREHDNLGEALGWTLVRGDAETARRLAAELARFWMVLGALSEGRGWLERAVAVAGPSSLEAEVDARCWASNLAAAQNDLARGEALAETALTLAREGGYRLGEAMVLCELGVVARWRGDGVEAAKRLEEALELFRELGEAVWEGVTLRNLGLAAALRGDYDGSKAWHEAALAMWRRLDHQWGIPAALRELAHLALLRGDHAAALPLYRESLTRWRYQRERLHLGECLLGLAQVALAAGQSEQAVRLLGAVEALYEAMGVVPPVDVREEIARSTGKARAILGEDRYEAAWQAGRALPLRDAMDEAAAVTIPPERVGGGVAPAAPTAFGLTSREMEVLRLLAEGRTNEEVAEALFISPRTAATHVRNILAKVGVESRAAAVGQAIRQGIV
ncbi:MAG: tetratricopeptide repeat protein, partial [Chloroflexota bacterium]|nr:tetratricopeptide repeat protein [Chloroflexota bacterium]